MRYSIRFKGHLDESWHARFDDLSIIHEESGTTLLEGLIRDQAALYGILLKLRHLGVTLLSLSTVETPLDEGQQPENTPSI